MHKLNLTVIDTAAEMPDFSIPESELEYKEEDADRKDPASHRKYLAQLELQVQCKKVLLHCTPYASECYCSTLKIRQHRAVLSARSSSPQVYTSTECLCTMRIAFVGELCTVGSGKQSVLRLFGSTVFTS